MNRTKIEWCDSTWNPVTGCLHGCEYCYARRIAERFGTGWEPEKERYPVINEPIRGMRAEAVKSRIEPYPYNFTPTFHRYRLEELQRKKKPQTIFVCSMADLFGNWVPDNWIEEVFEACEKAPQHQYLFLTKNPARYVELINHSTLVKTSNNMWFGYSYTGKESKQWWNPDYNIFVSVEPILDPIDIPRCKWLIVGAETGNRKGKIVPKKSWIDAITKACIESHIPLFMKDSLIPIVGEENMRREFPWEDN